MRRALLVLLIVLLPFQSVWAAVACTCYQESGLAASPFGGAAEKRAVAKATPDFVADQTEIGDNCSGCSVCHLGTAMAAVSAVLPGEPGFTLARDVAAALLYTSQIARGPDRPDRLAAR